MELSYPLMSALRRGVELRELEGTDPLYANPAIFVSNMNRPLGH